MGKSIRYAIAERIRRDYIQSGKLEPGAPIPPVRTLQEVYATSCSTILNALSILEMEGVLERRHGAGCFIKESLAQEPAATPTIGLLIWGQARNELTLQLINGIELSCRSNGYQLTIACTQSDYDIERQQVARLIDSGCKGLIIYPATRTEAQLRTDYLKTEFTETPIVLIDLAYAEQKRSLIIFDNYQAGFDMTEYLINRGHARIAFWDVEPPQGKLMYRSTRDRSQGYEDALRAAGLDQRPADHWVMEHSVEDPYCRDFIIEHLRRWRDLPRDNRPTALIALDDIRAVTTVNYAREMEIAVPDDLQIVGFDNLDIARSCAVPITTTHTDFGRAGEMAAKLVFRHITGQLNDPVTYVLPEPLVVRDDARSPFADAVSTMTT